MSTYKGYKQNQNIKQIIQELGVLLESVSNIEKNIYDDKLFREWATTSKQKLSDFIDKLLDSNLTLLQELNSINANVMSKEEFSSAINKLITFGQKIIELLLKSNDLTDFNKWLAIYNYNEEMDAQKQKINSKVHELNILLENARSVNSQFDEKTKEVFDKFLLKKESHNFETTEARFKKSSLQWLISSLLLLILIIFIAFKRSTNVSGLLEIKNDLVCYSTADSILFYIAYGKYIFSYILVYSILILALKVNIENYNANKHNEIINRNKKLILAVAIDLSREGKNPELLDIAAKELFTYQSTGYNKKTEEKSTSNFINNIVDMVSK